MVVRPVRLAVVGAGPSAFYCAHRVLSRLPYSQVHLYDRLWAPHGLVRYGVAPDHPEVKNCTHKFDETALDPRFKFFGNVSLSAPLPMKQNVSLPLSSLFPYYTHILLSHGASRPLPLENMDPSHTITALRFVHWYTGHPSTYHLPSPPLSNVKHITLVGHGNVSLDIARLLLTDSSLLSSLDISAHVLEELHKSTVEHVNIVSRRGPAQVAFTAKELRELLNLPNASMVPIIPETFSPLTLVPTSSSAVEITNNGPKSATPIIPGLTRQQTRILDLLKKGSKMAFGSTLKTFSFQFFRTPHSSSSSSGTITYNLNMLDQDGKARWTGDRETQNTDLVVPSLGYRSDPLVPSPTPITPTPNGAETGVVDGWYDSTLGRVRNVSGRVHAFVPSSSPDQSHRLCRIKNVYASGWAANGAKGVLASTMYDAYAVSDLLVSDHLSQQNELASEESIAPSINLLQGDQDLGTNLATGLPAFLNEASKGAGKRVVSYPEWKMIDEEERRRGQQMGKEKERMSWEEVNTFLS
ncbi:uncharacterized protein EI90DRAFT_3280061 [Cantharellus anzutake]|uniref:uncharacterized protein n=1 Tax=Cantharellus anzutake TaxID=1750568 RepID=UPI001906CD49|nr:uncharacterized protein EI90DRAFT_3280061 [Cantharellus anzutake]KAF8335314.1 hypothetical protein EI90DRAFT_3280061 [Cantharellus anzutake]